MNDEKEYEFSNIEREELPALQVYVEFYLRERKRRQKVFELCFLPSFCGLLMSLSIGYCSEYRIRRGGCGEQLSFSFRQT
jgi:hypothetical protein